MTRVLHTGDTHIGYRQYHSPERRADFLEAFRRVVEDAVTEQVDAVVHAGDLFHDRRPALADIHGTIEVLRELRDASIPFYAVVGNHERTRGQQWLDLFETLGLATRLGREPVIVSDVAVYGLDFVPRSRRDALEYEFEPHDAEYAALVSHGLFEPFAHADWDTRQVLESATVDFDVMLLGDNHAPGREQVADTWVTYCGSTERTDATERAERGYNLVTFEEDITIARRGIETRPYVPIDLELAAGEGTERVRERLREEDLQDAVVVVSITGGGDPVSVAEIETFAVDLGALVARVTDRREFEAAEVDAVRFADPDQAVQDRLRSMGLSDAALSIDDIVRDGDVAKTNVRERVKEHVQEVLEEDPGALEPTDPVQAEPEPLGATVDSGSVAETESETEASEEPGAGPHDSDISAAAEEENESHPTPLQEAAADADPDPSESDPTSDSQVTMDDYL